MASLFTRIVRREIPAHIVAEDDRCLAFLDINPLAKGHTLVIPKTEVDYYFDLDDELLAALTIFSKKVAHAIKQEIPCLRVGVCVVGLEIPHAHVHLIPLNSMGDINFSKPKLKLSQEELASIASRIGRHYKG
ncbi:MAG: HIT family protein [Bacteroidota bacterium]|jgi:histidine triad (HIT) family protein